MTCVCHVDLLIPWKISRYAQLSRLRLSRAHSFAPLPGIQPVKPKMVKTLGLEVTRCWAPHFLRNQCVSVPLLREASKIKKTAKLGTLSRKREGGLSFMTQMSQPLFRFSDKTSNCSKWPETWNNNIIMPPHHPK